MAEFLNYLYTVKKLMPGTIAGYKTALSDFLSVHSKENFRENAVLSRLLLSFRKETPKPVNRFPKWDLYLVLNFLMSERFEPMVTVDLKYVTWKTVFLVALATASRGSELHAMSFKETWFHDKWKSVELGFLPGFRAKTQKHNTRIRIPALTEDLIGSQRDRLLCPVRAIRYYRLRTRQYRDKHPEIERFFVSYKKGHSADICKSTVAAWIHRLVEFAYAQCPADVIQLSSAKTHEVRALATSLAWKANIPLSEILEAANWTNHNTFINHYLRENAFERDEVWKLGPVVAAQAIVQAQTKQ